MRLLSYQVSNGEFLGVLYEFHSMLYRYLLFSLGLEAVLLESLAKLLGGVGLGEE